MLKSQLINLKTLAIVFLKRFSLIIVYILIQSPPLSLEALAFGRGEKNAVVLEKELSNILIGKFLN